MGVVSNRNQDYLYRRNRFDGPPIDVDLVKSILEMRRVYKEKTDSQFIAWYTSRYRVLPSDIIKVLTGHK